MRRTAPEHQSAPDTDASDSRIGQSPDQDSQVRRVERFGEYELVGEIARGGMARVCLCRRAGAGGFQRLFALKVIHPHLADESEFVDMLLDEARVAARIHHPNVVGILDLGRSSEGSDFLVMDYIEGCTLRDLLSRKRVCPPELLLPIAIDVLQGLHAAHTLVDDHGKPLCLVHRDVSSQNILVGIDGTARIADFGIAKATSRITSTRPGTLKGKMAFISPEQLTRGEVDARSDIYAFGVVLWRALTGEKLFTGETDADTLNNVLNKTVPAPSTIGSKPPAIFDDIILRAMSRDPSARPESAAAFAAELRDLAMQNKMLTPPSAVGKWVDDTVGDQLAQRRVAVSQSSHQSTELQGQHAIDALPLPPFALDLPIDRVPQRLNKRRLSAVVVGAVLFSGLLAVLVAMLIPKSPVMLEKMAAGEESNPGADSEARVAEPPPVMVLPAPEAAPSATEMVPRRTPMSRRTLARDPRPPATSAEPVVQPQPAAPSTTSTQSGSSRIRSEQNPYLQQ